MHGESMQQLKPRALDRVAQYKDFKAQLHGIASAKFVAHMKDLKERKFKICIST